MAMPPASTGKKCPRCGIGTLVVKRGRFGPFAGCDRYPDCDYLEREERSEPPEHGMSTTTPSGGDHFDLRDPAVAAWIMAAGVFWNGGPRTLQLGVDMLVDGRVTPTRQIIQLIPPDLLALIDRKRAEAGITPLAEAVERTEDDEAGPIGG